MEQMPAFHEMQDMLFTEAMEMTTAQFSDFMQGRKEIFNRFYERVVSGLRKNDRMLMQAIANYRDKNIDILSSPYLIDYTKFNKEDSDPLYKATGITEEEMTAAVDELKKFIRTNCRALGIMPPDFANTTPFRVLLILVMRYYIERGDKARIQEVSSYYAYSMFYTIYYNYFRNMKPRKETMMYVMHNMSKKYKIRQEGSVDGMLTYSVSLCADTYAKRIMDCTDQDIIYVIGQIKSRIRDFIKNIKNAYVKADKEKKAVFISSEHIAGGEEDDDVQLVERHSASAEVERNSTEYTNFFIQKPVDGELVKIVSKIDEISRQELFNALSALRADKNEIDNVKKFYSAMFYIYMAEGDPSLNSVHSKNFLSVMDASYRKGNSKDPNIADIKKIINQWLNKSSARYREVRRDPTINNLRRAIYHYFVFLVVLRH